VDSGGASIWATVLSGVQVYTAHYLYVIRPNLITSATV
jgi:hypothetical protein